MGQQVFSVRGTSDLLPSESGKRQFAEKKLKEVCRAFGYSETRLPTFEYTELFARGVGDTSDVVGKEMYTFDDRGGRSITLRPEGTAGVVRSFLEHGVLAGTLPVRAYYLMPCYRYEKPQAGRLREYNTLGIELVGAASADADVEVIAFADAVFKKFDIGSIQLRLNSIGCPECRRAYRDALIKYFEARQDELCETCRGRLYKNPMRILDCKSPVCKGIAAGAPVVLDYLCGDCRAHFEQVKSGLDELSIKYEIDPQIVRGLDYYTRTVFEFVHSGDGYSGTVCGGGRYDGLVELLGGKPTPAVGFGMGIERLMAILEAQTDAFPEDDAPDIYIAYIGDGPKKKARALCYELREAGYRAEYDVTDRSLKAQLKYADKVGAARSIVIGGDELEKNAAQLKNMKDGSSDMTALDALTIAEKLPKGVR